MHLLSPLSRTFLMRVVTCLLLAAAPPLAAQSAPIPAALRPALAALGTTNSWTLDQQRAICEIPAPPFKEASRAADYRERLAALGLRSVRLDAVGNVVAEHGDGSGPVIVLSAHLDTVFPEGTDVRVSTVGTVLKGPGIGDDCRGLAVMLAVARALRDARLALPGTLIFAATVGEEGLGNSRGALHLLQTTLKDRSVAAYLTIDLTGFDIVNTHVGSHRYRVTFAGPGGHSYSAFGMPNPVHALGRAVAAMAELTVPTDPRTTFSVGVIEGGRSVNAIADQASFQLDMRSSSAAALSTLDEQAQAIIQRAVAAEKARWPNSAVPLAVRIDTIGVRYAGVTPPESPLVQLAMATARALGGSPTLDAASTDANAAARLGIPAIAIGGGGSESGGHSLDEQYDDGPRGWTGPQWALLLVSMLAGLR